MSASSHIKTLGADQQLLQSAVKAARDTKAVVVGRGARRQAAQAFAATCAASEAIVVADETTFAVAGQDVYDSLKDAGQPCRAPFVFPVAGLYAEYSYVDALRAQLESHSAIPVAVGSGTINDLVKRAAFELGRPYLAVATAASMDGYTAFGASITKDGSKQTFDCPAPVAVLADLDVIVDAPVEMNASGYADLIAKSPAGADWILADAVGEEPIDPAAWEAVQQRLPEWLADPAGVRRSDFEVLERLTTALLMTGFAMQMACTSRPASGAEHQFSHLWDMEHHVHLGQAPSHGFKVGVGSIASARLYEALRDLDVASLDVDAAVEAWPDADANEREIEELFVGEQLIAKAKLESQIKHLSHDALRRHLVALKRAWSAAGDRLFGQLIPAADLAEMLAEAGCPSSSDQIGIPAERLRRSYLQAYHIRRRYTVLDCARRAGLLESALDVIFSE